MKILHMQRAFTLLELIFVTVILGIVASIGSSIVVQIYESYINQKAVHNASLKTELAINQLANRLTYRINRSLLARVPGTTDLVPTHATPLQGISLADSKTHTALEWIGYENDGFTAQTVPRWSGFCDLNKSIFKQIRTTASRLKTTSGAQTSEQTILNNLSSRSPTPSPAIIFMGPANYRTGIPYDTLCMYKSGNQGCMFPVTFKNNITLSFKKAGNTGDRAAGQMIYSEFYQLAASAYAVVPERDASVGSLGVNGGSMLTPDVEVWNIYLYSDYQPWNGDNYLNGSKSLLAKNVSVLRFRNEMNSIRIKICSSEKVGDTDTISICKEKAVIR